MDVAKRAASYYCLLLLAVLTTARAQAHSVARYGNLADGKTETTAAIRKAVEVCFRAEGSTVAVWEKVPALIQGSNMLDLSGRQAGCLR